MSPNKKRPWTAEDDEKLMALASARRSTISIAAAMKRSKGAVVNRLSALRQRTRDAPKDYRVFRVSPNGSISELPASFSCASDAEAIELARTMTAISSVEIWQGARFIISLPRAGFPGASTPKS